MGGGLRSGNLCSRTNTPTAMKNILVLTDFSHHAMHALHAGADLVRRHGGSLHVLHVYFKPLSGIALQVEVDNAALRKLHGHMEEAMEHVMSMDWMQGIDTHAHMVADKAVWDVVNEAQFADMDLIICGSRGNTDSRAVTTGSVARKVVQFAETPVLVLKKKLNIDHIERVVFASNFYTEAATSFGPIGELAELFGAELHLLKVITPAHFERTAYSERLMQDFASTVNLKEYTMHVYNDVSIERGIECYVRDHGIGLVAMETHGRKGLSHLFYGSTTEDVLEHLETPLLSTHIVTPEIEA